MQIIWRLNMQFKEIKVKDVIENPWNPNEMTKNQLEHLKAEYKRVGYLQPILARPYKGKYQIVDGVHRFRAYKSLNLPVIPAIIKEMDNKEAKTTTLNMNEIKGENNPIKYAELIQDLRKHFDIEELANILNKTPKELESFDLLLNLPDDIDEKPKELIEIYKIMLTPEQNETFKKAIELTKIRDVTLAVMEMAEQFIFNMEKKNG